MASFAWLHWESMLLPLFFILASAALPPFSVLIMQSWLIPLLKRISPGGFLRWETLPLPLFFNLAATALPMFLVSIFQSWLNLFIKMYDQTAAPQLSSLISFFWFSVNKSPLLCRHRHRESSVCCLRCCDMNTFRWRHARRCWREAYYFPARHGFLI